jgi:hypothetical protein
MTWGQEALPEAGWASVRRHGALLAVREALAGASETSHPQDSLAVYAERVERLADQGGNPAYAEAAALARHMGILRGPAEQVAYVADLKASFGRRRNLMKLLGTRAVRVRNFWPGVQQRGCGRAQVAVRPKVCVAGPTQNPIIIAQSRPSTAVTRRGGCDRMRLRAPISNGETKR